jgi:hypothetical protein
VQIIEPRGATPYPRKRSQEDGKGIPQLCKTANYRKRENRGAVIQVTGVGETCKESVAKDRSTDRWEIHVTDRGRK